MDTLSLVSKYLNGIEDILDDEDSLEARKLTVRKSKEELELFKALDHKSLVVNEGSHKVVVFKKSPPRAYDKPFTWFSLPCNMDGQGARDAELDMAHSFNYMMEERFDQLGFVRVEYGKYEKKRWLKRDFLVTSKSRVDFGISKMRIDLTMLEEMKEINVMLDVLVENLEEVGSSNGDLVKMDKASHNKNQKVNKVTPPLQIKIKEIPLMSTIVPPSPIYHPLTQKQKEKVKEALDRKYKELEESKPILEVLENYMTYQKKLDEVLMGRARLNSDDYEKVKEALDCKYKELEELKLILEVLENYMTYLNKLDEVLIGRARLSRDDYGEEVKMRIVKHGLPKKICDLGNFVLLVKVKGTIEMNACEYEGKSKAMGEVKNVRIQIGYQANLVDVLILDIPVDKELLLLLGRPFLRTCEAVIDMGRGTLCIDDGVIRHAYFPKPRDKAYLYNFA
nr:hypothetical protein [Tanacetum cinerariifolium]